MNISLRHAYRLAARGGAGLACDEDGLALGAVELARRHGDASGERRCIVRSPDEIGRILRTTYGPQPDDVVLRLHRGLRRAAAWIEAGDLGRAGVEAVMLGLPSLTPAAMAKLAEIADLEKTGTAWRTEPRVPAGQAGGGQWTTGDSGASTATARPARNTPAEAPCSDGDVTAPVDRDLLVPVSTAAIPAHGYGAMGDFALPPGVARLGRASLLTFAAALLDDMDAGAARKQIADAMARFGLDPSRAADVVAASAYVWSKYALPFLTQAPFSGGALDAASQAVMRAVMVNPGAFVGMMDGDSKSSRLILAAANSGLSDYASESRARPKGVDPALQTTSYRARKAIAHMLKNGRMDAHHLIPANVWEKNVDIADLARMDEWRQDSESNLIGLPVDTQAQEEVGGNLPIHRGSHPHYDQDAMALISIARSLFPTNLTPIQAHAIFDDVASTMRRRILDGIYNPTVKVES